MARVPLFVGSAQARLPGGASAKQMAHRDDDEMGGG